MSHQITEVVRREARTPSARGAAPLLVLLHGYGSHEDDLVGLAPYLPPELALASLRAPLDLGHGGYAWVPVGVPGRPDPAAVDDAADAITAWLDAEVAADVPISLLGFSQGGLMASQLLRRQPARFVCAVVLAGFVLDATLPGDAALAARKPPVFFGHGDADLVITPAATDHASRWLPAHSDLTERSYPGLGHSVSAHELDDVSAFLRRHALA